MWYSSSAAALSAGLIGAAAGGTRRGQQDGRSQALALAKRVVGEQVVQRAVSGRPVPVEQVAQLLQHDLARLAEESIDERSVVCHGSLQRPEHRGLVPTFAVYAATLPPATGTEPSQTLTLRKAPDTVRRC